MKSLHDHFTSLCKTLDVEYRESVESHFKDDEGMSVTLAYMCSIWRGDELILSQFACPANEEGITEETKETARERLLYSLMVKAL